MHRLPGLVTLLVLAATQAFATEATRTPAEQAEQFAINNSLSALYHEFGHLFIDQFQLPILGREEDAADAIATLLLLRENTDEATIISYDTVDGYFMSSALYGESIADSHDFADQHGLDVQRAYQMACLLVGGNPEQFEGLAEDIGLEAERIEACGAEFELAQRGWARMMIGHLRGNRTAGAAITTIYDPPSPALQPIADLLKSSRVLERVAETVTREFVLLRPATIRATLCDEDNAFYDPDLSEITICYEYAKFYSDMLLDPESAGLAVTPPVGQ